VVSSWLTSAEAGASIRPAATQLMRTFLEAQVAAALRCMAATAAAAAAAAAEAAEEVQAVTLLST
jgi:hypothetical protein